MTLDVAATGEQAGPMAIPVARLNHAVLFVRDAVASAEFYSRIFGFEIVSTEFGGKAVFLRAAGGDNHHDLGLFSVGPEAPRAPRGSTGLYHLAWEVPTIEDLASAAGVLAEEGALGGASDHGVSKSLYGSDPDGNEFEIMWRVPLRGQGRHHAARHRRGGPPLRGRIARPHGRLSQPQPVPPAATVTSVTMYTCAIEPHTIDCVRHASQP